MRMVLILLCLASPAAAWEASRDGPVCLLAHTAKTGDVLISHDLRKTVPYAIQLRRDDTPWINGEVFAMRFDGPMRFTITTDRHQLTDDGQELAVTDSGFENVLRGLEENFIALATLGSQSMILPLTGAAPEVAKFRSCALGAGV